MYPKCPECGLELDDLDRVFYQEEIDGQASFILVCPSCQSDLEIDATSSINYDVSLCNA